MIIMLHKKYTQLLLVFFLLGIVQAPTYAQCKVVNNYFDAGETMEYDLYFKYGIIYTKAGWATMKTTATTYNKQPAYKMTLVSATTGVARKAFSLTDTLSCQMSKELVPLTYNKWAHEDGNYTKELITYQYSGSNIKINTTRTKNGDPRFDETINATQCTYDMMSVVYYARTLDYTKMKSGASTKIYFMSGKNRMSMDIVYQGTETEKMNDGQKYDCIKLSLRISDKAFDGKEAMKVYITNDSNRMPIRIESKLKVGSTRAILKSYKGNKHPVTSKK